MKKMLAFFVGALLSLMAFNASAVIDVTAVTTGISDAQTALLAIIAALMALSIAIFGIVKVYRFIEKKSGA